MIEWTPGKVQSLISAFGGTRPMADKMGHKNVTTIDSWIRAGRIPSWRIAEITLLARKEKVRLPGWFKNGGSA
jgi:hypothetical protein